MQIKGGTPMKVVGRAIVVGAMIFAVIGVMPLIICWSTEKEVAAQQQTGQWVDPANPSDELVDGPYRVDPNWPKPLATRGPDEQGWTWGATQGIFAQNPNRIFVAMRGELPDVSKLKSKNVEVETADGRTVHLSVPTRGAYVRNASVGPYASPGEATNEYLGEEGKDYRWRHIISVYDSAR